MKIRIIIASMISILILIIFKIFTGIQIDITNRRQNRDNQISKTILVDEVDEVVEVPYGEREVPNYKNLKIVKVVSRLALDSDGHVWEKHENTQGLFPVWKKDGSLLSDIIDIESSFGETFYAISKDHTAWTWGSDSLATVAVKQNLRKRIYIDCPEKIVYQDGTILNNLKK